MSSHGAPAIKRALGRIRPLVLSALRSPFWIVSEKRTKLIWVFDVFPDRELQREKVWSRIHIVPLLLAEGDRDAYRRQEAALRREREIMKDVKGWEVSHDKYRRVIV